MATQQIDPPPPGACDCHAHVYGPAEQYKLRGAPRYAPPPRYFEHYRATLNGLGISRAVVVQPTVYETNAVTEDALIAAGGAWRGVAKFSDPSLITDVERMHSIGFRGVRLHGVSNTADLAHLEEVARRIAPFGWHIQLHMESRFLPDLESRIAQLPVPVVHDHFARLQPELGSDTPPMHALLRLLERGRSWLKLSGSNYLSKLPWPHLDLMPIAMKLAAVRPDRMLWGTDWPHPSHPDPKPDDTEFLALLALWVTDRERRNRILVDNPEVLYGFPAAGD
jgi:predicted TIM-barrel fold metal-dependent hydrolase